MDRQDDICRAGNSEAGIKIISTEVCAKKKLLVTFSSGEKRLFDPACLKGSVFAPLKNEEIALHPTLFHGVLTWEEGSIDIAPEAVYEESEPVSVC